MKRTTVGVRLALLSVAVVAMLGALPATAFAAKATTKFTVASSTIVNHDTATENLWPVTVTAKIQVKSHSRYIALKSGTVKLYLQDPNTGKYVYKSSVRSSSSGSLTFTIPQRGKYKIYYAGSSTRKSCTSYTTVSESIGVVVGEPSVSLDFVSGTTYLVRVAYDVTWNTAAWDGPVVLWSQNQLQDAESFYESTDWDAYVDYSREIWEPRTVDFRYLVDEEELAGLGYVGTFSRAYTTWDQYITTPNMVESSWAIEG